MSGALVIAEHDGTALAPGTLGTVGAAGRLGVDRIDVAVLAADGPTVAAGAAAIDGVGRVLLVEHASNAPYLAAVWAPQIAGLAAGYTHLLAPATTFGKDLMPRVAALLGVGMLSDVTGIDGAYRFSRPIYAGNAIERLAADPKLTLCATVRPSAFETPAAGGPATIEAVATGAPQPAHTRLVEHRAGGGSGPDLQTAARVVAGGRGLGGPEGLRLVERLAAALGAAVGASRAAVDAGWVTNDLQVGQTGKIIAPELYVAVGISGAIQHLTGIKDAGTIVAINTDTEAPLSELADIVLVENLFTAVPALIEALDARRATPRS